MSARVMIILIYPYNYHDNNRNNKHIGWPDKNFAVDLTPRRFIIIKSAKRPKASLTL